MSAARSACSIARARMARAFDNNLPVEEVLALEEHAEHCPRCGPDWKRTSALSEALGDLPEAPVGGLDLEGALASVNARIDALPANTKPLERLEPRPVLRWVGAAAAGLLGVAFGWSLLKGGAAPSGGEELFVAQSEPEVQTKGSARPPMVSQVAPVAPLPDRDDPAAEAIDDYDPARRGEVLLVVQERLADALGAADPAAPDASWAQGLAESNADLIEQAWPLDGLLRSLVEAPGDPRLRAAALRATGALGGRLAAFDAGRALEDPELQATAVQTLVELWPDGRQALARAWWLPGVQPILQQKLGQGSDDLRCQLVVDALASAPRGSNLWEATEPLAELLLDAGPKGARELIGLLGRSELDPEATLVAIGRAEHGSLVEVLLDFTEQRPLPLPEPALLAAAGASGAPELLGWVLERADRGQHREAVAAALAQFDSMDALDGMVQLEASRRVDPSAFLTSFAVAAERAPEALEELALGYTAQGERELARRLLELCAATETRAVIPTCLRLCADGHLPAAERQDALLGIADRMEPESLDALAAMFKQLGPGDGPVAAAALVVARDIEGERGTAPLLQVLAAELSGSRRRRLVERLHRPSTALRGTLYTLTNLLEPCLSARSPLANSTLENL